MAKVKIPNCAIDELSLETLGFYSSILDRVQNDNAVFSSKKDLIKKMLIWHPNETKRKAEKAWNELVKEGYILHTKNESEENVEITYGPYGRIGEQ